MSEAVKTIRFKTLVDQGNALAVMEKLGYQFEVLDKEMSKTSVTASGKLSPALQNVSRRDLGMFASQLLMTSGVTGRFTAQLSNMATGLATGGATGAAFAGFAAIIQLIGDNTKQTILELNAFQKAVDSLINIQTGKGAFNIKAEDIPAAIEKLKSNIKGAFELSQSMTVEEIAKRQELNAEIIETNLAMYQSIEVLERQKKKYDELAKGKDVLSKAGLLWTGVIEKENREVANSIKVMNEYEEMLKRIAALRLAFLQQQNEARAKETRYGGLKGPFNVSEVAMPIKPDIQQFAQLTESEEEMLSDMRRFSESSASIFAQNMGSAWESIFGEANSMFEQMISNWANMLFEKVGFGIFNMLFGGIDFFGFARNLVGGQATADKYRVGK